VPNTFLSPPETTEGEDDTSIDTLGNNPILFVDQDPQGTTQPQEKGLSESLKNSFKAHVHESAGVPLRFPGDLREEVINPDMRIPLLGNPWPQFTSADVDRSLFPSTLHLILDYLTSSSPKYIHGIHS